MNTIECYKCDHCSKLFPKENAEFVLLKKLHLSRDVRSKGWDPTSVWTQLVCEYTEEMETLFCNADCLTAYLKIKLAEK